VHHEIEMPRLGQGMDEGRVLRWLKDVGDQVEATDAIAEIETDKAVVEMESFVDGTLVGILVHAGETVPVGTPIAVVEVDRPPSQTSEQQTAGSPPSEKDRIRDAPKASPVARRLAAEHNVALGLIQGTGPGDSITKEDVHRHVSQRETKQTAQRKPRVLVSPAARHLAAENNVDLSQIDATGPRGSITKQDVEIWLATATQAASLDAGTPERMSMSKIRAATAQRMVASKATVPHFYVSMDIDVRCALTLRASLRARGYEVSINDLVLKATALALVVYPQLNATYSQGEVLRHPHIDLALAVALEDGLITPVIHHCETLTLIELAAAAQGVTDRVRHGRLRQQELDPGTFTVSNLGMYGVKQFEAIVNPPHAAILAVGAVRRVPIFNDHDQVVPAELLTVTVSADHRITDGAEVARFLGELKRVLEDGFELILGTQ
jgi:pyruvate dehydrogenase E2 component (dihydrolipoamide acetyltransferase)